MGKKAGGKSTETTKERASVSRERRLALALRAVLDQNMRDSDEAGTAYADAETTLNDLGFGSLEGIPKQVARLNEQLATAMAAGDGATIAKLGTELARVKAGKLPRSNGAAAE